MRAALINQKAVYLIQFTVYEFKTLASDIRNGSLSQAETIRGFNSLDKDGEMTLNLTDTLQGRPAVSQACS